MKDTTGHSRRDFLKKIAVGSVALGAVGAARADKVAKQSVSSFDRKISNKNLSMTKTLPSERVPFRDEKTGARMIRWTDSQEKDQHLYFTSPSVTDDDRRLVILSERTGHPNIFVITRTTGELQQLSDNRQGLLYAYVYPNGGQTGLSKASPSMDSRSGRIVWVQDNALWATTVSGSGDQTAKEANRVIDLPVGMITGFTHVSAGGKLACVPVASSEAFETSTDRQGRQMAEAFAAFCRGGLKSRILIIDIENGEIVDELVMPFWITHVMFSAGDPSRILFNQEGGTVVSQRIWRWQRTAPGISSREVGGRPLYPQSAKEWMSHENFDPTGELVIAHGGIRETDEVWFEKRDWDGRLHARFPTGAIDGRHAVVGTDGVTVLLDPPDDLWSWNMETGDSRHLCVHGSTCSDQDSHVHPTMTPDQLGVVFTSDCRGVSDVYEWRAD